MSADTLVAALLRDAGDRRLFADVDSDVQAEIRATWRLLITKELQVGVEALKLLERIHRTDCVRSEDEELYDEVGRFLQSE